MKNEFVKNAFNQEASIMSQTMVNNQKLSTNAFEIKAVHNSRPTQVLKTKKPEQILLEVRNRKIAELNQYKEASSNKKIKDI